MPQYVDLQKTKSLIYLPLIELLATSKIRAHRFLENLNELGWRCGRKHHIEQVFTIYKKICY